MITFTKLSGPNAELSGLFLDPYSAPAVTASFLGDNTTMQGNWIGTDGTQGYDVIGNSASIPSYAKVTASGNSTAVWASKTTDVRGLETSSGKSRLAACWYSASSFTVNIDLLDGLTHELELYFLDWDTHRP